MYFEKFYEGAVITGIQDPDNVGNDLEEIEYAVEDSHDEEVDDALCGLPGEDCDPFEESAEIVYEAEYNFNMICKSIGLSELNEAARGSLNENKFTDAMGKAKNKVVDIVKAFVRWLVSLKDKVVLFYNKMYANIVSMHKSEIFNNDKVKNTYKENKKEVDTYISNLTLDNEKELLNYKEENYAYAVIGNIGKTIDKVSFDEYKNTITVKTNKLSATYLDSMVTRSDDGIRNMQTMYKSLMKKLDDDIKAFKKLIGQGNLTKENVEPAIKRTREDEMNAVKMFNYFISLKIKTEKVYKDALRDALKDIHKNIKKSNTDKKTEETPKTESAFDIKFM